MSVVLAECRRISYNVWLAYLGSLRKMLHDAKLSEPSLKAWILCKTWLQWGKCFLGLHHGRVTKRSSSQDGCRDMTETHCVFILAACMEHLWDEVEQDNHNTTISELTKTCRKWLTSLNRRGAKSLWNFSNAGKFMPQTIQHVQETNADVKQWILKWPLSV